MKELERAIKKAGGVPDLANELEIHPNAVYNWRQRGYVPAVNARIISLLYPGIRRRKLEMGQ